MGGLWNFVKKLTGVALILLAAWRLLADAPAAAAGVSRALTVCGSILIPSLFPFMVLAALMPDTRAGRLAAAPFGVVGRLFYRLPATLAPALFMSWIGGYPAGAHAIAKLVDRGELSPDDAGQALCVCVNSGPAFMVTVVGAGIFGSPVLGLKLFGCQLAAGVLTGALLGVHIEGSATRAHGKVADRPFAEALVSSVASGASAMISICAFVLIMGATASVLEADGVSLLLAQALERLSFGWLSSSAAEVLITGALEICGGCAGAATLAPLDALKALPFLLSFGGVSVICQVMAAVGGRGVPLGRFVLSRLLHGLLTAAIAYPLLYKSCAALSTGLSGAPVLYSDPRTALGTLLLLCVCGFLCFTLEQPAAGK